MKSSITLAKQALRQLEMVGQSVNNVTPANKSNGSRFGGTPRKAAFCCLAVAAVATSACGGILPFFVAQEASQDLNDNG